MFDEFSLPELVDLAKRIQAKKGDEGLVNYQVYGGACGCVGPQNNDRLRPCKKAMTLKTNMIEIVSQFDEDLAKLIWLRRFVAELPG